MSIKNRAELYVEIAVTLESLAETLRRCAKEKDHDMPPLLLGALSKISAHTVLGLEMMSDERGN